MRRAAVWPQHYLAHLHRPRPVAVRRDVGGGGNLERRVPDRAERSRARQWRIGHRLEARLTRMTVGLRRLEPVEFGDGHCRCNLADTDATKSE